MIQVIEMLSSLPLDSMADKNQADAILAEKGLTDPVMRAFALTNLEVDPITQELRWKVNIDAISK